MPENSLLERLLAGEEVQAVMLGELEAILRDQGYNCVGTDGPYRTWKHDDSSRLLTIRDGGPKAMYASYVDKAASHLRSVRDSGGEKCAK